MQNKAQTHERIDYVDWIKGVGILSIVLAHVTQYFPGGLSWLNKITCSYHVPIFFIACGLLASLRPAIYEISYKEFLKKRFIGLLVPYIIFSVFNSSLKFVVLFVTHGLTKKAIVDELWELLVSGNGTQWFLLTLFLVELIHKLLKEKRLMSLLISVVGVILPFYLQEISNPFVKVCVRVIFGYAYFTCGYFLAMVLQKKTKTLYMGCLLITAGILTAFSCNYKIEFFAGIYMNGLIAFLCSLSFSFGFILILFALKNIDKRNIVVKTLDFFGKNSIVVMLFHTTMLLFVTYPFGNLMKALGGVESVVFGLLLYIVTLLLQVPCVYAVDRYFPILRGRMK